MGLGSQTGRQVSHQLQETQGLQCGIHVRDG